MATAMVQGERGGIIREILGPRPGIFVICLLAWTLTNMDQALFGFAVGDPLGRLLAALGAAPLLESHGWRASCFLAFLVVPLVVPPWSCCAAMASIARRPPPPRRRPRRPASASAR